MLCSEYVSRATMNIDVVFFFFFNDTATTEIYTLSLHDALPISVENNSCLGGPTLMPKSREMFFAEYKAEGYAAVVDKYLVDRKSTRLNSSHANISYAVFCLKKKNITKLPCLSVVFLFLLHLASP